jgi:hypothetical protein
MDFDAVATGKWGSGVMHGDPEVKVIVQWMAASECGREVNYHVPYDVKDRKFIQRLREFTSKMMEENITVGQLWDACSDLADFDVKAGTVFESMLMLVAQWKEQERAEMQDSPMPLASQPGSSKALLAVQLLTAKMMATASHRRRRARLVLKKGESEANFSAYTPKNWDCHLQAPARERADRHRAAS